MTCHSLQIPNLSRVLRPWDTLLIRQFVDNIMLSFIQGCIISQTINPFIRKSFSHTSYSKVRIIICLRGSPKILFMFFFCWIREIKWLWGEIKLIFGKQVSKRMKKTCFSPKNVKNIHTCFYSEFQNVLNITWQSLLWLESCLLNLNLWEDDPHIRPYTLLQDTDLHLVELHSYS